MVRDAYASSLDHQNDRLDKRIQRLANTRPNLQNAERVMESILPVKGMMEPHHVPESSVEWVLLPHETLAWLQTAYPRMFSIHAGAKEGGVQDWWEGLRSSPSGQELWGLHPWLQRRTFQYLKFHVSLMLFDDAGPISNTSSSYVCVFYSLLGVGSDKQTRFLMATGLTGAHVEDKSWAPLMESFEKLAETKPEGVWGGILLFFGADLEYVCNKLGLPHFNAAEDMCSLGLANTTTMPHNNYHDDAEWRGTEVDNTTFLERLRRPLHACVAHPWFNIFTYRQDLLHMCHHQGVSSHFCANIQKRTGEELEKVGTPLPVAVSQCIQCGHGKVAHSG